MVAGGAAVLVLAPVAAGGLLLSVALTGGATDTPYQLSSSCTVLATSGGDLQAPLSEEQLEHARTIIAVGRARAVPPHGWVVALATAMQESTLRNLSYGDRDSLGLFQQRPSQGWGTPEQTRDPVHAAGKFFDALVEVPGWQAMAVTEAAQTVQRSAFPLAYARHEPLAATLVRDLGGAQEGCERADGAWVVPLTNYRLTSGFGSRIHPIRRTLDSHTGLDFGAPAGTPVMSASDGVVSFAGPAGGYGNLVKVSHASGVETWYAHLSRMDVVLGQELAVGGQLGAVGSTGNSTGPHLHLEVRVDGSPVDPQPWLAERGQDPS